jgi:hypothetical protein
MDYRSIVELVELMDKLKLRIGLKQVPYYTIPLNHRFNGSSRF